MLPGHRRSKIRTKPVFSTWMVKANISHRTYQFKPESSWAVRRLNTILTLADYRRVVVFRRNFSRLSHFRAESDGQRVGLVASQQGYLIANGRAWLAMLSRHGLGDSPRNSKQHISGLALPNPLASSPLLGRHRWSGAWVSWRYSVNIHSDIDSMMDNKISVASR